MEIKPITETVSDEDAVVDVDAVPVGEPNVDVDADDHQLRPIQIVVGLTEIGRAGTKNVLTIPADTRSMQPLCK